MTDKKKAPSHLVRGSIAEKKNRDTNKCKEIQDALCKWPVLKAVAA